MTKAKIKNTELIKTKRAQILRTAEELFASKGYHKTSMRDIAKHSGISSGSLYDYIQNKEDLLYLLTKNFYDNLQKEIIGTLEGGYDVKTEIEGTIESMIRVVDRFQEYVLFTYRDSKYMKKKHLKALSEQDAFFTETFTRIIEKGVEEGVFKTQAPEIVATLLAMLTHSWALKRYTLKKFSLFSFQRALKELVLNGLLRSDRKEK